MARFARIDSQIRANRLILANRFRVPKIQRRRDDNKNRIFAFEGGGCPWGQRGKSSKNACFRGKRHDNNILKVQILLSRNFVVIAQAPNNEPLFCESRFGGLKIVNRRFEALRVNRSHVIKNSVCFSANRFARIALIRVANRQAI